MGSVFTHKAEPQVVVPISAGCASRRKYYLCLLEFLITDDQQWQVGTSDLLHLLLYCTLDMVCACACACMPVKPV